MKIVIQRVTSATVKADPKGFSQSPSSTIRTRLKEQSVGASNHYEESIGQGLFVLFGAGIGDTKEQATKLAHKLYKMRLMRDENDKMNLTVTDVNGEFLVVSQFTLYGDTSGGNRPSFVNAMAPDDARELYEHFVGELQKLGATVKTGSFGNYMKINCQLDGPVTILVENKNGNF